MARHVKDRVFYDFYYSYEGKKTSYNVFRKRVVFLHIPMEEAIKPQQRIQKKKSPIRQFWEDYKGPKAKLTTFMRRVYAAGLSFEEAILPSRRPDSGKRGVAKNQHISRGRTPEKRSQISAIDITLQPEEASVFRKAYARMLSELEDELVSCENPSHMVLLNARLSQLKEEIGIFNLYN